MDLDARLERIAALMEERLGIHGSDFAEKFARAGRKLPRKLRREGALLIEAQALAAHPKLAHRVDARRLRKAARVFERYLERVDGTKRRSALWVNWLAGNALNILIVFGLAVALLVWRGLV